MVRSALARQIDITSDITPQVEIAPEVEARGVPDEPIDYSVPHKSRQTTAPRHFGFFPYPARKPWQVVQRYIEHYTVPGDVVCDPFAGSGVTPVESLVLRRRAIAGDISPMAGFITRMLAIAPVDLDRLQSAFEQVQAIAQTPIEELDRLSRPDLLQRLASLAYPRDPIPASVRRAGAETVDQMHTPRQLAGLAILREAINQIADQVSRDLLRMAMANAIRYANRTYSLPIEEGKKRRAIFTGDANILRRYSYSLASEKLFYELPVWPAFERGYRNVREAKEETNRLIGDWYSPATFRFAQVPAAHIHEITGEGTVDYCFTDPPYSNDIHFLALFTLWTSWLDLEIDERMRHSELLIDKRQAGSREQFERQFAASVESIARALKPERWFTLVYKHPDLSLWQMIVKVCEDSGLQYMNAVWQDIRVRSTRQIESPDINPSGDMYLNFRKMSLQRFERIYGRHEALPLPTRPNYVEHEVERLLVSYLGAEIELITASVIQQILDSRAFRNYRENPAGLTQDIQQVLTSPRFARWEPRTGTSLWVMTPGITLDASLPATDRIRYYLFEYLREHGEATEGEIRRSLLTRLAGAPGGEVVREDITKLLREVGQEVTPHHWRFDADRVAHYKQLRLFFDRSTADLIREHIEQRDGQRMEPALRPDLEGLTLLSERLREANSGNKQFEVQFSRFLEVLNTLFQRLRNHFGNQIERVQAIGEWAEIGMDLRNLPFEEVVIQIVVRTSERPFSLYQEIAEKVFVGLQDEDILLQFELETTADWQRASQVAAARGQDPALGIPLLTRVW